MPSKPPKSATVTGTSKGTNVIKSPHPTLAAAIKTFCDELKKQKKRKSQIKGSQTVNILGGVVREHRRKGVEIDESEIGEIVRVLDDAGDNICSRFESSLFSVLLQTILQGTPCRAGEHGLQLLAVSLFNDSHNSGSQRVIRRRKDEIGSECLDILMEYFVTIDDHENMSIGNDSMRRWAGILCSQLLSKSSENLDRLEVGSDLLRRKIGPLVINERNELNRVLAGRLVRDLRNNGVPLKTLFPTDYNPSMYASLPQSTQDGKPWMLQFDTYVDNLYEKEVLGPQSGELHFILGVSLEPSYSFGAKESFVYLLIMQDEMSLLAPSSENSLEQVLDVPLRAIKHMSIGPLANSQYGTFSTIMLEVRAGNDNSCYLDSILSTIKIIHFRAQDETIRALKFAFGLYSPGFKAEEVEDETQNSMEQDGEGFEGSQEDQSNSQNPSLRHGNSGGPNSMSQDPIEIGGEFSEAEHAPESSTLLQVGNDTVFEDDDDKGSKAPANSQNLFKNSDPNSGDYQRSVSLSATPPVIAPDAMKPAGPKFKVPGPPKRTGPKPVGKPPIVTIHKKVALEETKIEYSKNIESSSGPRKSAQSMNASAERRQSKPATKPYRLTRPGSSLVDTSDTQDSGSGVKAIPKPSIDPPQLNQSKQSPELSSTADEASSPGTKHALPAKGKRGRLLVKDTLKPAANGISRSERFKDDIQAVVEKKHKRFSLNPQSHAHSSEPSGLPKSASMSNIFDMPDEDNESSPRKKAGKKNVQNTENEKPSTKPKTKGQSSTGDRAFKTTKLDAKAKRRSAPAAMKSTIPMPTRHSQRAAAAKANSQMLGVDHSDDEEPDDLAPKPVKTRDSPVKVAAKLQEQSQESEGPKNYADQLGEKGELTKPTAKSISAKAKAESQDSYFGNHTTNSVVPSRDSLKVPDTAKGKDRGGKGLADNGEAKQTGAANLPIVTTKQGSTVATYVKDSIARTSELQTFPEPSPQVKVASQDILMVTKLTQGLSNESGPEAFQDDTFTIQKQDAVELGLLPEHSPHQCTTPSDQRVSKEPYQQKASNHKPKVTMADKLEHLLAGVFDAEEDDIARVNPSTELIKPKLQVKSRFATESDRQEFSAINMGSEDTTKANSSADMGTIQKHQVLPETAHDRNKTTQQDKSKPADLNQNTQEPQKDDDITGPCSRICRETAIRDNIEPDLDSKAKKGEEKIVLKSQLQPDLHPAAAVQVHAENITDNKRKSTNADAKSSNKRRSLSDEIPVPSSRRSPRLQSKFLQRRANLLRSENTNELIIGGQVASKTATVDTILIDEHKSRKPTVVSFDPRGPQNQGGLSSKAPPSTRVVQNTFHQANEPSCDDLEEFSVQDENLARGEDHSSQNKKRKHVGFNEAEPVGASPPRKRQNSSPGAEEDVKDSGRIVVVITSSPPLFSESSRPSRRQSSQASRVDLNGSPMASPNQPVHDHFEELANKLSDQLPAEEPPSGLRDQEKARKAANPSPFGPRITLGTQPKAIPSSPTAAPERYIAHKKTINGHYEDLSTKAIIAEEMAKDPFTDQIRKPNTFTQRLQQDKATANYTHQKRCSFAVKEDVTANFGIEDVRLPRLPKKEKVRRSLHDESTLVEEGSLERIQCLDGDGDPSDMSSDSSDDSSQDGVPIKEKNEPANAYNMAIRPHYTKLRDAVHRIADQVIVQLSDKETAMGLLVEDYDGTGTKIVDNFATTRENDHANAARKLGDKKYEMGRIYFGARENIQKTFAASEEFSVSAYEKEWKKEQCNAEKTISNGFGMVQGGDSSRL